MSELLYRDITNSHDEAFCIVEVIFDGAGKPVDCLIIEANPIFINRSGRPAVIGQTIGALYPQTEQYWYAFYENVAFSGKSVRTEAEDKSLGIWFELFAFKIGSDESRRVGVFLRDITERKRMEELLRQKTEELQNNIKESLELVDGFTEGSWIVDRKTGTIQCSEKWAKRIGLDLVPEQDRLSYMHTLSYPPDQQDGNSIEHCMETGTIRFDLEYRVKTVDSGYVWTQNKGKIVYDAHGIAVKIYAVVIDITERKKAEEALRQSEQKARALVAELVAADKNKNRFISVLSHELRNPLAVIVAAQSLQEITDNQEQVAMCKEAIKSQIGQITKLVDDLLDLTRINENKIKLKKETISLNELLRNAKQDIMPRYMAKGVKLRLKLPKTPAFVSADPVRLAQCIGNLLQNALQYTQETGTVTLSLDIEKGEAFIGVRDNGIGMSGEFLEHVFIPFVQADESLDRPIGGLGLGLSIVKGIVEQHGGILTAFSEGLGKGSLFTIRLPVSGQEPKTQNLTSSQKNHRSCKVLLIEDNQDLIVILRSMLGVMGYQVFTALSGPEGITAAVKTRPDVIFCDLGLRGLSGYEVAKTLKATAEVKDTYLIALTGYAGGFDIERAMQNGFDRHLAKPVDAAALEKILAEV
jgi:PAS domain S-box-containing protein